MSKLAYYRNALGFDQTTHVPFSRKYRVRCSACASTVINEVPCHERGCPHDTHECRGCNARVPVNQRYCGECQ